MIYCTFIIMSPSYDTIQRQIHAS